MVAQVLLLPKLEACLSPSATHFPPHPRAADLGHRSSCCASVAPCPSLHQSSSPLCCDLALPVCFPLGQEVHLAVSVCPCTCVLQMLLGVVGKWPQWGVLLIKARWLLWAFHSRFSSDESAVSASGLSFLIAKLALVPSPVWVVKLFAQQSTQEPK